MTKTPSLRGGYGLPSLHLGMTTDELVSRFGKPNRTQEATKLRLYWLYDEFDCIVSNRTHRILSIFLKKGFSKDALFQIDEAGARELFGNPEREGGDFDLDDGYHVNRWLSFRAGIGFEFNQRGRVDRIYVFRRSRRAEAHKHSQALETYSVAA